MRRTAKIAGLILIGTISLASTLGCQDGVRQTLVPYVFSGLQTLGQDVAGGLGSSTGMTPGASSGIQSIIQGLIAGLEHQAYPEQSTPSQPYAVSSPTSSSNSSSSSGG